MGVHEAVHIALDWRPSTVLLDWHLGSGNGGDVLRRIRTAWADGADLPRFILLTGELPERIPPEIAGCGFAQILAKPCEAPQLARAVFASASQQSVNESGDGFATHQGRL